MSQDRAYANGAFIKGADEYPPRWTHLAEQFRDNLGPGSRRDVPYGPAPRQKLDLFLPEGTPNGLLVFVHGGYWMAFGRETWSHLAAGALARGWACALPSYTLAPDARITDMTAEIARSVICAADLVPGPVVVTGHSAGGHLAARMACTDVMTSERLVRVVPISPLADLAPLMQTGMNDTLHLDAAECAAQSPARLPRNPGVQAHIWVGGQERPAFLWQARTLSEDWSCDWTVDPGKHHFDVVDGLMRADSPVTNACLNGL
ncbi:MAG: alpha/beta hydrolase [Pseudomonadota bacterium]